MASSRNRIRRTEEEEDIESRLRWDRLFVAEEMRQRNLARFNLPPNRDDSDDDLGTASPNYDRCLRVQGPDRVLRMCNFAPIEFERLWDAVEYHVLANWNVGRGEKSVHSPKDVLFMTLVTLKHCGSWDAVSSMFDIEPSPFQKMIKTFLAMLEPYVYDNFVVDDPLWPHFHELPKCSIRARSNIPARKPTDRGFHHAKKYFSRKHQLYGYKVEVSVLPSGAAVNCTSFEPGGVADLTMFRNNSSFHTSALQKLPNEFELIDDGPLLDKYENDWTVLVDKGYQGLVREFRAIQPKKKARGAPPLTMAENQENDLISHDRVIVENVFGRLKTLWGVSSQKWEWDDKSYDMFFRGCATLTNYSGRCCPLRREDGKTFSVMESGSSRLELKSKQIKRESARSTETAEELDFSSCSVARHRTSPSTNRRPSTSRSQNGSPCSITYGSP